MWESFAHSFSWWSFVGGLVVGGTSFHYLLTEYTATVSFLDHWQILVGAFLGASVPLGIFFLTEWYQAKARRRAYLLIVQKYIVSCLNNLIGLDAALHYFMDTTFKRYCGFVEEDDRNGRYSVGQAFVPLLATFPIPDSILNESTDSSYLDTLVIDLVVTSRDLPLMIEDISRQFDRTLAVNRDIGLAHVNGAAAHNHVLKANLLEFKKFIEIQMFQMNIPRYTKKLVATKVPLLAMIDWGLPKWRETFPNKGSFTQNQAEKMDEFFSTDVIKELKELQPKFKSNLFPEPVVTSS